MTAHSARGSEGQTAYDVPALPSLRAPMDHPSRKVRYATVATLRPGLVALIQALERLMSDVGGPDADPETRDELIALRRYLREAQAQIAHLDRANDDWAYRAAADAH